MRRCLLLRSDSARSEAEALVEATARIVRESDDRLAAAWGSRQRHDDHVEQSLKAIEESLALLSSVKAPMKIV